MILNQSIQHVSLSVTNLEMAKHFYENILCLKEMERPPFDSDGAWYEIGSQQIHLIVDEDSQTLRKQHTLNSREGHLALRIGNYKEALDWLIEHHIEYREDVNGVSGFDQIYCNDPDGNLIELNVEQSK
ncbi:VOC family protein [Metabacillus idriensis]|uniref:VOC family protein n=1 Tax=Metabacillus idriensis TaxID=324768 RepID=UPI0028136CA1|nr:VOC family protein [Metabacillus idriensis]MDR0139340.1 VOC family protein [Metabacillus idriensis]